MASPRKVFRIEEMVAPRLAPRDDGVPALDQIKDELAALRGLLGNPNPEPPPAEGALRGDDVDRLTAKLRLIRSTLTGSEPEPAERSSARAASTATTRIAQELQAVMAGSEQATVKILAAAEDIDQAANTLSAALRRATEQGLAQDIRDRVIAIFEACNFQDLTSQRVAKVLAAMNRIEAQIGRVLDELARDSIPPACGPRLEGEPGHVSQSEVDSLFSSEPA